MGSMCKNNLDAWRTCLDKEDGDSCSEYENAFDNCNERERNLNVNDNTISKEPNEDREGVSEQREVILPSK